MIVVSLPDATPEQFDAFVGKLEAQGFSVERIPAETDDGTVEQIFTSAPGRVLGSIAREVGLKTYGAAPRINRI